MTHVKLVLPEAGAHLGSLLVDGDDVSVAIREVAVVGKVGHLNEVTIKLGMSGVEVDGIARLYLSAAQVGLLARFGWAPPEGYQMNDRGDVLLERLTDRDDPRDEKLGAVDVD